MKLKCLEIMYFIGDINYDYKSLKENIFSLNITNESLFQLGNLPIEKDEDFENKYFTDINKYLKNRNCHLYLLRGNHDNPHVFKESFSLQTNINIISDNSILEIENHKIFVLGGGISVDRIERNKKSLYWTEESINIDFNLVEKVGGIDIVLTHKPPSYIYDDFLADKFISYWVKGDACLENQLSKERDLLRALYKKLIKKNKIKYWISSHQNLSIQTENNAIKFISLKNMEFFKLHR